MTAIATNERADLDVDRDGFSIGEEEADWLKRLAASMVEDRKMKRTSCTGPGPNAFDIANAASRSTAPREAAPYDAKDAERKDGALYVAICVRRDADEHAARTLRARRAKSWLWRLWWRLTERRPRLLRVAR